MNSKSTNAMLDQLNAFPPWQKISDRLSCLTDDPACRSNVLIHAGLLVLIILLAASRKVFLAMSDEATSKERKFSMAQIDSILVYPVKSAQGVRLTESLIKRKGIELDRRWIVLKKNHKSGEWEKIILKDEPKMVWIQTAIDEDAGLLRLSASPIANKPHLKPFALPLKVNREWELIPKIEMYGDAADGRVVQATSDSESTISPREWVTDLLGYEAMMVQYDPEGTNRRNAFPLFKGSDLPRNAPELQELKQPRGIEFADEYPLLVASTASLEALRSQIRDAVMATDGSDGRGGKPIASEKIFARDAWRSKILTSDALTLKQTLPTNDATQTATIEWMTMIRFRPNIILKSVSDPTVGKPLQAWEEDHWSRLDVEESKDNGATPQIHIAANCKRCLMTTVDPTTGERTDVSVPLAFLRRSNNIPKAVPLDEDGMPTRDKQALEKATKGPCFGVYAVVPAAREGMVRVGDLVRCSWRAGD